jgi:hypothetical protein
MQLCYRKPFQFPFGRVGGTEHGNLDTARTVDRYDFGGRADERDLKINITRLGRCVISHDNPVPNKRRANHAAMQQTVSGPPIVN